MRKTSEAYRYFGIPIVAIVWIATIIPSTACFAQGLVELEFADQKSGEPVSARILITKASKKIPRPKKLLFAGDQWLAESKLQIAPPNGDFEFVVQRGPEFSEIHGGFTIEPRAKDKVPIAIPRSIDMHSEHWYSGDHLSGLPMSELQRWQRADAVDMVVSIESASPTALNPARPANIRRTGRNEQSSPPSQSELVGLGLGTQSVHLDWGFGAVLLHRSKMLKPKEPSIEFAKRLHEQAIEDEDVVHELIRPWARDVPFLLATDSIRSVQILSDTNRPDGDDRLVFANEPLNGVHGNVQNSHSKDKALSEVFAPIEADERIRFKDARAVGKLSEALYWQMLEAGFRMPPTAGSGFQGSGKKIETQVGYNRVYVYSETVPDQASWWRSIIKGNTFVTNGPLLRANINGVPPGSVFTSYRSQSIPIDIAVSLSVRDTVDYLDVVFNGEILYSAKLEDHYKRGEFPPIEIDKSGWLVIRVVTEHSKGYRFATTAPFYFVFDGQPRISRKAVSFFQRWHAASVENVKKAQGAKPYEAWIEQSLQFWNAKMEACNCD